MTTFRILIDINHETGEVVFGAARETKRTIIERHHGHKLEMGDYTIRIERHERRWTPPAKVIDFSQYLKRAKRPKRKRKDGEGKVIRLRRLRKEDYADRPLFKEPGS